MGFGCNAAGVVGCRIIDSKRERLIAILTNNFVPCNGRFPIIISVATIFFLGLSSKIASSLLIAFILTLVILLSILITFIISKILSVTLLKGENSLYTLELPPYRRPKLKEVIIRSLLDRTIFVLGRAIMVAAPAGIIIWLLANISFNDIPLLRYIALFLEPLGRLMGLDGTILLSFILGFPANEIVLPIAVMAYTSGTVLTEYAGIEALKTILLNNGWTYLTAVNTIILSVFHFPCSTTMLSIYKETKNIWWTVCSFIMPTVLGMVLCILTNLVL